MHILLSTEDCAALNSETAQVALGSLNKYFGDVAANGEVEFKAIENEKGVSVAVIDHGNVFPDIEQALPLCRNVLYHSLNIRY
jgi:hypothetical protein